VTPDFYVDAKGSFEAALETKLDGVPGLEWATMPPQPDCIGTPDAVGRFDAIFCLKLTLDANALAGVERTALIARWGVGYDTIDTAALTAADIALAITPSAVRRPVAEGILTMIFAVSKNLRIQDQITRSGKWRGELPRFGVCVGGRTLGSVGCGNIGSEMFRLAASLGFGRFIAHDPYADPERARKLGVELVDLDTVFRESDYVAINTLLNDQTRGMIGEEHFRAMKPTAYFINTARGPIVQEQALVRACREGWIAGAGIDVFEHEPPGAGHALFELDNVTLAPHGIAWTEETVRDNGLEACDNILAVFHGEAPPGIVNREVLERPGFQAKLARYRERHS
jgi:phosphoglycerate dehydrogenase-like enzyme